MTTMNGRPTRLTMVFTTQEGDVPYKELLEEFKTAKAIPTLELDSSIA
jgi:hypothetical protein